MLESDLVNTIGISKAQLRKMRKERPSAVFKKGREIHWTDEGVDWVKDTLDLKEDAPVLPTKFPAIVFRPTFPNTKIIQVNASPRGMKELLTVRVRDSSVYVKHMAIEIKKDGNGWTVTRHPRQRGRF